MKTERAIVKSKKAQSGIVGEVEIPIYESVEEAFGALGQNVCLDLINTQNGTNIKNRKRNEANPTTSDKALREKALGLLTAEEIQGVVGDPAKWSALLDAKVAAMKAAMPQDEEEADEA